MKAVVVHDAGDLRVEERACPEAGPGEVLIAVEWGGICGSDLSYVRSGAAGTATLKHPLVLGHEIAGRVAACGAGVPESRLEQPVAVMPASLPGEGSGDPNLPLNRHPGVRYLGSAAQDPHTDGGFQEFLTVAAEQALCLPPGVGTRRGALAEPLAVALHAVRRSPVELPVEDPVLVNGCGPIGLLVLAVLRHQGVRDVIAADISAASLERASALGAAALVDPTQQPVPREAALSFDASGAPAALGQVLRSTRRGGSVVQVGNLPSSPSSAALGDLVTREITWRGSFRFDGEMEEAIRLLDEGLDVDPIISHTFEVGRAPEAFDLASDPRESSGKVLLRL